MIPTTTVRKLFNYLLCNPNLSSGALILQCVNFTFKRRSFGANNKFCPSVVKNPQQNIIEKFYVPKVEAINLF